ncbi:hypothetical protein RLW55_15495 [Hyphomicrobium sp. B1]|uniref:hypothetical protein n=1 Tax=Hyphomicrobium sp. B1 TaxID=3075651 RepID=UPI003C2BFFE6
MHTKDFASALRAFAAIADFDRSYELHRLAAVLDRGRDETIAARVKRMSPSEQYPGRLKETLDTIAVGLHASGAVKASSSVRELLKIFTGRPGASVDDFCTSICLPPAPQGVGARRFKSQNAALANDICSELAPYIDDAEVFRIRLDALIAARPAGIATWTLVANRLVGNNRTYRDRKSAVRAIFNYIEARSLIAPLARGLELAGSQ